MKKIIHIDMDYFYAQVEELERPELKNKPVAIGGIYEGRGVLSTCNYIARRYGVRSAMPTLMALKLCPDLILVTPQMDKYRAISKKVFEIFAKYTDIIQPLSLDEAFLDVTGCQLFNNDAQRIAKAIKNDIYKKTGLTASAGVSYNKLLAKIGSELFKPDGLAILRPENIEEKISHFPVERISGVGKVTQEKMAGYGIRTFKDLQKFSKLDLINMFGSFGPTLFNYCRGIDNRVVKENTIRKSLSVEKTFRQDTKNIEDLKGSLKNEYCELMKRLDKYQGRLVKSIFIKIKYFDFTVCSLEKRSNLTYENFENLFDHKTRSLEKPIRLLGLGVRFYVEKSESQLMLPLSYLQ